MIIWGVGVYSPRSYGAEFLFLFIFVCYAPGIGQMYTATSRVNMGVAEKILGDEVSM